MIVLASTSSTRRSLLANAGVEFATRSSAVDETSLIGQNPRWTPSQTSLNLARQKALDVSRRTPDCIVIGADQVLACDGIIYSKPKNEDDGRSQLLELRGRTHSLISSVVSARNGVPLWGVTQVALLKMRQFSDAFLDHYISTSSSYIRSSVGGYQLERHGLQLFDSIDGDYFTILGLPMLPLLKHLRFIGEIQS